MVSRSSDIHADDVVLGVQTADKELLAVESRKERAQGVGGSGGIPNRDERACMTAFRHEAYTITRNTSPRCHSVYGFFCHV